MCSRSACPGMQPPTLMMRFCRSRMYCSKSWLTARRCCCCVAAAARHLCDAERLAPGARRGAAARGAAAVAGRQLLSPLLNRRCWQHCSIAARARGAGCEAGAGRGDRRGCRRLWGELRAVPGLTGVRWNRLPALQANSPSSPAVPHPPAVPVLLLNLPIDACPSRTTRPLSQIAASGACTCRPQDLRDSNSCSAAHRRLHDAAVDCRNPQGLPRRRAAGPAHCSRCERGPAA